MISFPGWQAELKYGAAGLICRRLSPITVRIDDGPADRQPHPIPLDFVV
jgi:hypothetical protein